MPTSQAVNSERLTNAEDYFLKVLKPNYDAFCPLPTLR
jgi:hypothetical protein